MYLKSFRNFPQTVPEESEIYFTNFSYRPEVYYFLYVGDLKNYSLNCFIRETLGKQLGKREVQFIALVPDICTQYNYSNLIVINPLANREIVTENGSAKVSCRLNSEHFMQCVSQSSAIGLLIEQILQNQNQLYINLYESLSEMTLDRLDGVSILGPDKHVAQIYNNKVVQYQSLNDVVPLIEGCCCRDRDEMLQKVPLMFEQWPDGIFVSCAYSAGGANSAIVYSYKEVEEKFTAEQCHYLLTRYIPHKLDPTVLAVVANETDVYIAGIADQHIAEGNKFIGSTFPSITSSLQQQKLREYTIAVGKVLGKAGYRGIFGCDYLIDDSGQIYFLEINARKQGTTLEFCFTLEQSLPEGSPMLPELEYFAVTQHTFPQHTVEMDTNNRQLHWSTYNYKTTANRLTCGYIPQNPYERETFQKIARQELVKDFVILEHLGTNFLVLPGTFLARVVSVARCPEDVKEGITQGVGFIRQTLDQNWNGDTRSLSTTHS